MSKNIDLFVISLAKPILVGIYENNKLIKIISKDGMTSDILPIIIEDILKEYCINNIVYVNGPGSYMAIKIAYIFLKTICITKQCDFYACSGFELNNNSPIKALGKKYFVQDENSNISIRVLNEDEILEDFALPSKLDLSIYSKKTLPNYQLPAVV